MMTRASGRTKPCSLADARARLGKARQFLELAQLAENETTLRSAEASNLVLAGIAAADAICCVRLGERADDGNHTAAVVLLKSADSDAARRLDLLLALKSLVQYDTADPSANQLKQARRAAAALLERAVQVAERAGTATR